MDYSPSLDQVAGLFPASSGRCGPHATDRSISSIGALFVNQASVPFGACSPWAPLSLGNESSIGQTARFGI